MIIEGGQMKCAWGLQLLAIVFGWLIKLGQKILFPNKNSNFKFSAILIGLVLLVQTPSYPQDCDVEFPGASISDYSSACGGGGITDNLSLGKVVPLDNGDIFNFDTPSTITINGDLNVFAQGDGKIVIPAGVTVIVQGDLLLDAKNGGCKSGNTCSFTFEVQGHLLVTGRLRNKLISLNWQGTGTVEVTDLFENTGNGCMTCAVNCPNFPAGAGGCSDTGVICPTDFCAQHYGKTCDADDIAPTLTNCPANITVTSPSSGCDAVVSWTPPTPADNCTIVSLSESHAPGSTFPIGITTVTYLVQDGQGNLTACSFIIEVIDDTPPVISNCPADQIVLATDCANTTVAWTAPTVVDNCGTVVFTSSHSSGQVFPLGITTVTYTATDNSNNATSCSFQVEVVDDVGPIIVNCPTDLVVTTSSSACDAVVTWTPPTATDNCSLASFASSHNSGNVFPKGSTMVTYTATDDIGNTTVCSFQVDVVDTTDPVISGCPTDIIISASSCSGAIVNWTAPTAIDNCNLATFTTTYSSGGIFPLGQTTVTYTAIDDYGNTATCSFQVNVADDVDPVITNCPADLVISVSDCATSTVNWTPPIATDNCNVSFSSSHTPGEVFSLGITTVTYTAIDDNGNTAVCGFEVELIDDTDPVITNCPTDVVVPASNSSCNVSITWTPPMVTDNCNLISFVSSQQPGDIFPLGITTVTYIATDEGGNVVTCSFDVTVEDQQGPIITNCPPDILVASFDPGVNTARVNWTEPLATDNCSLSSFSSTHQPGDKFSVGQTVVTYSATDANGNQQTCSFTIEVLKNSPPTADNVMVQTKGTEVVRVCFDASDKDGDGILLSGIDYDRSTGQVDQIDDTQLCFSYTPALGSKGVTVVIATICDDRNPSGCSEVKAEIEILNQEITIYKAFSPNGDAINDLWHIGNIEQYPENSVIIFDRWGSVVYEATGYNNENIVWDGRGNGSGFSSASIAPAGTYFYNIKLHGSGSKSGYVELIN